MLQAMRQNTKVILWITIVFFILLIFLVWGADLQFGNADGQATGSMGSVNGEPITTSIYQSVYQQNRQYASQGGRDLQPSDLLLIEEDSWNSIIDDMILMQEADRRGLDASDSEVRTVLLNDPPPIVQGNPSFLNEAGQFDINRYRAVLLDPATPESFLLQLESYVRGTLPVSKLQRMIVSGAKVTEEEVRSDYLDRAEVAKIDYLLIEPATGADVSVTDAEVEAHLKENPEDFALPRRADVIYVSIPREATAEDTLSLQQELSELAAEARQAEEAVASGQENLRYSDFETLSMTFSDGPNADQGGLSTGYLTPQEMTVRMRQAVEGLAPGEISEPFREGAFMRIVQMVDVKTDTLAYQIRDLALRIVPSDETLFARREQLDAMRTQAGSDGLEAAATEAGITVNRAKNLNASGFVPGLAAIPRVASFALDHKPGTVSRVYETNNAWFLVEVEAVHEAGPPELADVAAAVKQKLVVEKRLAAARSTADQMVGQLKLGTSLEEVAAEHGLTVVSSPEFTRSAGVPGLGREADLLAESFLKETGEIGGPVKAQRGWVVFRVADRPVIDETDYQAQAPRIRQNILSTKQNMLFNAWMEELRKKASVEDFRI